MGIVLALLGVIVTLNLLPFLAHLYFGERFGLPVDGGRCWRDGRPLLGPHKTVHGLAAALAGGLVLAPLLGVPWWLGLGAAVAAMAGDLATSFIKRRRGLPSGAPVAGLDQFLEALLPVLWLHEPLGLHWWQASLAVALFVPLGHLGSRYWRYLLYRPPLENYPRIVRSATRLREWRACHLPLARWQTWLNFESYVYYRVLMARGFRLLGWYERGLRNTLAVGVEARVLLLQGLPPAFDGFRILLLTDLHLDGTEGLAERVAAQVRDLEVDLCLVGGDIRMEVYGPMAPSLRLLRQVLSEVRARDGLYGVLGNHDCIEMLPEFEQAGLLMLVNDAVEIQREGASLWLVGIDDPHFYRCHDLERAFRAVPEPAFKVLLAHSPEAFREARDHGAGLYLCGHTHGGQICLPGIGPLFTHSSAPRYTAAGLWRYHGMTGYTSRGVGASGVPLRFNCPGEISLITLRSAPAAPTVGPPRAG